MTANSAQTLASALELHKSGQVRAAERLYREILSGDPRHVDALNLLGAACLHLGNREEAIRNATCMPRPTQLPGAVGEPASDNTRLEEDAPAYD